MCGVLLKGQVWRTLSKEQNRAVPRLLISIIILLHLDVEMIALHFDVVVSRLKLLYSLVTLIRKIVISIMQNGLTIPVAFWVSFLFCNKIIAQRIFWDFGSKSLLFCNKEISSCGHNAFFWDSSHSIAKASHSKEKDCRDTINEWQRMRLELKEQNQWVKWLEWTPHWHHWIWVVRKK